MSLPLPIASNTPAQSIESMASSHTLYDRLGLRRLSAVLVLADGSTWQGFSCGVEGTVCGEVCFNTSMTGYAEILTDPSYAGQLVCLTYPQIGNYGVCEGDLQRDTCALSGLIVGSLTEVPSNWRSTYPLHDFLCAHHIVAIEGIDTRSLVRHVREQGAQTAIIATGCHDEAARLTLVEQAQQTPFVGINLVKSVSCDSTYNSCLDNAISSHDFALKDSVKSTSLYTVVAYDCGMKHGIIESLQRRGCSVQVVPWNTSAQEVLALKPDGIFLSNGPGDPSAVQETYQEVRTLIGEVPLFGICLGHQMIAQACDAHIIKLAYGHRGGNHPVMNLVERRVEITPQNHGFAIDFSSLGNLVDDLSGGYSTHESDLRAWVHRNVAPVVENSHYGRIQLTHVSLNDGTVEGISLLDKQAFSVQYHPEGECGPMDAQYLFDRFIRLMELNRLNAASNASSLCVRPSARQELSSIWSFTSEGE